MGGGLNVSTFLRNGIFVGISFCMVKYFRIYRGVNMIKNNKFSLQGGVGKIYINSYTMVYLIIA